MGELAMTQFEQARDSARKRNRNLSLVRHLAGIESNSLDVDLVRECCYCCVMAERLRAAPVSMTRASPP